MNKKMLRNIIIAASALVVVVGIILGVVFIPSCAGDTKPGEIDPGVDMRRGVTEDGLHYAVINTNEKGKIENNSYGTLIEMVPSQIEKISVSSPSGNYTFLCETPVNADGTTEATVYTLEGFEDYTLETTNPSLLADAVCNISFTKVADLNGEKSSEFGFDTPRASAEVYYTDGTRSVVILGGEAAGGGSCYIKFGDSDTIYVASSEDMAPMLYSITDLFSTSINVDATSVADDSFDKIILGGTHLSEEITIVANTDTALNCYYVMSSKGNAPVNNVSGSSIVGSIKSLTADSVVCVNPDDKNMSEYGLKNPYATVRTNYKYDDISYDSDGFETGREEKILSVSLIASKADSEGFVFMMEEGGNLIYKIPATSVYWATVTEEMLRSEYVFSPAYSALSQVEITASGKTYRFKMGSEEVTETDDEGNATTATRVTVSIDGKTLDESQFYTLFQDISLLGVKGTDTEKAAGDMLTVKYNYKTGRADDTVVFSETSSQKVTASLNGVVAGYVYKSDISAICENVAKVAEGKEITSVMG
ncbi:MAG: DUF4340 domain-containing protein [Ruminococcus sp.]|nr:DUF4340 domain-containing protein [Ruminococcus sp.]